MSVSDDYSDITIHITIPYAVVAATRDEREVTGVNKDIRHRVEYLLWTEGAYLKRYPPKKLNGHQQAAAPPPPPQQPSPTFPRPQMGRQKSITGDDPGSLYKIKRTDRCSCGCGSVLPIGTEVIFRTNADNERECWRSDHWNAALARQQGGNL